MCQNHAKVRFAQLKKNFTSIMVQGRGEKIVKVCRSRSFVICKAEEQIQ